MISPESLKDKVKNIAKSKRLSSQEVLQMFFFERFLERLSHSKYKFNFVIKGGLLISSMIGMNQTHAGYFMAANKRIELGEKIKRVPMGFFNNFSLGKLTTLATTNLTHVVVEELKTKSSKNLFRKLNGRSKELQAKQEEIVKKHNSLVAEHDELEHLKNNMNDYLGRNETEKKKESIIGAIKKHRSEEREISKEKNKISKEAER